MRKVFTVVRNLAVLSFFIALSVMHTWPLADVPARQIHAQGDAQLGMWSLTEMSRRILIDPIHLMDGNIFYPFRNTLAIVDHQFSSALLAVPLEAAGASGVYIYNVTLLVTFALSGFFMYLLARRLTGSTGAAVVAGCVYAFSGYRALHLAHAHLLATQWLPLSLLALHRYVERPTWMRWGGLAVATLLLALASWHVAIIGAIGVGLVAVWVFSGDVVRARRPLVGLLLVAVLCGLALVPFADAYMRMGEQWPPLTGQGRETLGTIASMSANLAGLVAPAATSATPYKAWLASFDQSQPGVFPGLAVIALILPALMMLRRLKAPRSMARDVVRVFLLGTTALVVLVIVAAVVGPPGESVVRLLRPVAPFVLFGAALAAVGLAAGRRAGGPDDPLRVVLTYTVVSIAGALLALGPRVFVGSVDVGSGLWRFDLLPVRLLIRAPERLSLLLTLGTSVLAGIGMARLLRGRSAQVAAGLTVVLLLVVNADLRFTTPDLRAVPGPTDADRWLAQEPDEGAVIDYPLHWSNFWAMYASQYYGRRVVNGTGYLIPSSYLSLQGQPDLSVEQLAVLSEHFHPRFAVVRTDLYAPAERTRVLAAISGQPGSLRERARFGSEYIFEVVDQGRGQELVRRWPAGELRERRELRIDALVTEGRSDTVGELVVALNGRALLEAPEAGGSEPVSYRVPFTPEDVVEGINTFEITASYRFAETAETHPVGTTGTRLAADVAITADRERAVVTVNGRVFRPGRGYFLVVLDPVTGRIVQTGGFDVSWNREESDALVRFVDAVPAGAVVAVTTEFDASRELTDAAVEALTSLGLGTDLRGQFQVMHAAIGVKGAAPGTALEETDRQHASIAVGQMDGRVVELGSLVVR